MTATRRTIPDAFTDAARVGYEEQPNPHLFSSPMYYAHELGRYFLATGRTLPQGVRMGRGYSIRANDMLFSITHTKHAVTFNRTK